MLQWFRNEAIIFDEAGRELDTVRFNDDDKTFQYGKGKKQGSYNIDLQASSIRRYKWFRRIVTDSWFYKINNPDPVSIKKTCEPKFDARIYNTELESKAIKDLHDAADKEGINWNWKWILGGLAVVVIIGLIIKKLQGG